MKTSLVQGDICWAMEVGETVVRHYSLVGSFWPIIDIVVSAYLMSKPFNEANELIQKVGINDFLWPFNKLMFKRVDGVYESNALSILIGQIAVAELRQNMEGVTKFYEESKEWKAYQLGIQEKHYHYTTKLNEASVGISFNLGSFIYLIGFQKIMLLKGRERISFWSTIKSYCTILDRTVRLMKNTQAND
ncbi:hypothetical protein IEQ34_021693 [Dendrobium chrysotoxum]|uniref:Uncharacterized protein n=1 Tax=Dendrobium chrysotoxum TaxID=161865 RepID=A0AAV7G3S1_DENCH|nr:hypothetical protein IEQ34_021693 [Dendrobium chrysotoxum]